MKRYNISLKKNGLLLVTLVFYEKKIEKKIIDKLMKNKILNVNIVYD